MSELGLDVGSILVRRCAWVTISAAFMVLLGCTSTPAPHRGGVSEISAEDVQRFVDVYSTFDPSDTTCRGLSVYFSHATAGLNAYSKKFGMGAPELCAAIRRSPARYARITARVPAFDSAQNGIRAAFAKLVAIYPEATLPSVYFVVGDGIAGGTSVPTDPPTVLIGAELVSSVGGIPWTVAHEAAHAQQRYPAWKLIGAGPSFIRGTVLAQSIKEGSADFIAHLVTGEIPHSAQDVYGRSHELAVWAEFQRDMHGKDYRHWLYNGESATRPSNLGYWMGYRITQAYYDHARDKAQAIHDIFNIKDFDQFLAASHYNPVSSSTAFLNY